MKIKVETSMRHIHLCKDHLEILFGKDYRLEKLRDLNSPNIFAAKETIKIVNGERFLDHVRIVGPLRDKTQVELSLTDTFFLKIKSEIRISGDLENTPGITLIGPKGEIVLKHGVIVSWRHIHLSLETANSLDLKNREVVSVRISGDRAVTFNNVIVRVSENFKDLIHLDSDEGNACGITRLGEGTLVFKN